MGKKYAARRAMDRQDRHAWTCLASVDGYEFVFPTGIKRWSTITNKNAERLQLRKAKQIHSWRFLPKRLIISKYLDMAKLKGFDYSKFYWYDDRETAIITETAELDFQRSKFDWPQYG